MKGEPLKDRGVALLSHRRSFGQVLSQWWRLEVLNEGVGEFAFFWGPLRGSLFWASLLASDGPLALEMHCSNHYFCLPSPVSVQMSLFFF